MPLQPILQIAMEAIMFCPSLLLSRAIGLFRFARILNEFRKNWREILTATNRLNDYYFGRNWNADKGAEYDRIFESTSVGVAAKSNRC